MSDLISRQAAIDATMETVFVEYEDGDPRKEESIILQTKAAIRDRIKALPPVQPTQKIIHCKDCKHWIPYDWMFSEIWRSRNMADYPEDEIGCDCCDMSMGANDFCSRAERRTDE